MTIDPTISLAETKKEIKECERDRVIFGWEFSGVDDSSQSFSVTLTSAVDKQHFILRVYFDDYKEKPLNIDFADPISGELGTKRAYPKYDDSFFHEGKICICHPCSRKAYTNGLHHDWNMAGWRQNPKVGSLTNIRAILRAIQSRINDSEHYKGRMA